LVFGYDRSASPVSGCLAKETLKIPEKPTSGQNSFTGMKGIKGIKPFPVSCSILRVFEERYGNCFCCRKNKPA